MGATKENAVKNDQAIPFQDQNQVLIMKMHSPCWMLFSQYTIVNLFKNHSVSIHMP